MKPWLTSMMQGPVAMEGLAREFPWAPAMIGCPHDALYHAEGDPWIHTSMVAAELERSEGFGRLAPRRRQILRLAAWMHDIAKPATTEVGYCEKEMRMRVRQPGHAPLGAKMAWQGLVDAGCDPTIARAVHALVFWHQRPHHMMGQKTLDARVIRFSVESPEISWSDLLRLCRADNLGRISPNIAESVEELELLEMHIEDMGRGAGVDILDRGWPFRTEAARLRFLRGEGDASAWFTPPEPAGSRMILMSGLPGSGKNTWIRENCPDLPVVELDVLREKMGVLPTDNQGRVLQAAMNQARIHLRAGQDFIWNAASLTRFTRQKVVQVARDYDARIEAVSIDVPLVVALRRNSERENPVPAAVMEKLALRREPVLADEAHCVTSIDLEGRARGALMLDPDMCIPEPFGE